MALKRQVKNFVKNYSEAEIKVREATSNDPWGPSSSLMLEISDLTFSGGSLSEIMNMLWQRLNDHGRNWRHVYKSLTLMDYLIKNGSKKVIQHCRECFFNIQTLKDFQHVDEAGKDQGYYVREKSKQIIALLMDEQLLQKEREIACRTRRRTSYSVTFPKRLPATSHSPTSSASAPPPENPASENKRKLFKVPRLHRSRLAHKTEVKQEQNQSFQMPSKSATSQETLPLKTNAWKSTEDLIIFYDDEAKTLWPPTSPANLSSASELSKGQPETPYSWDSEAVPASMEQSSFAQGNLESGRRPDITISNFANRKPLQLPPGKPSALNDSEALGMMHDIWSPNGEEFVNTNLKFSTSDKFSHKPQASVETLYVSSVLKAFHPSRRSESRKYLKSTLSSSKQYPEMSKTALPNFSPRASSIVPVDSVGSNPYTQHDLTSSGGTPPFFSSFSISSPDSATVEDVVCSLPKHSDESPFWPSQGKSSSSIFFKDMKIRVNYPPAPFGVSSDEEEISHINALDFFPNNSNLAGNPTCLENRTVDISESDWVAFSTQEVSGLSSVSRDNILANKSLPEENGSPKPILVILGEIKSALEGLRGDLSNVVQELRIIKGHLVNMARKSQETKKALRISPTPTDSPVGSSPS
ncbi:ENTH domain-containing protein 1 isoform X1 [Ornithorhynchus anatinus]|uniref:ENTH domain-containing protein 1 isoform X1 n=1 Tax=Ornithorhynchus anatinus TaxID=9258 RepID=UPI0004549A3B|nr:ENTH domain-containing protein 1 isoform X1 [Ornithorhynchus anatinus]XP_007668411.1 ENTH domain-containing protein 1 isoform X1 [Ornithorhynchus anatinus]